MKPRSRSILSSCGIVLAFGLAIAVTTTGFADPKPKKEKKHPKNCPAVVFGCVAFDAETLTATGDGYTVTRDGLGIYTITYDTPFAGVPNLVLSPAPANEPFSTHFDSRNPLAFQPGCTATNASATGVTIVCIQDLDPTSEPCADLIDQFGNVFTVCVFTQFLYADLPFKFAAFE